MLDLIFFLYLTFVLFFPMVLYTNFEGNQQLQQQQKTDKKVLDFFLYDSDGSIGFLLISDALK